MSAAEGVMKQKFAFEKTLTPSYDFNHLIDPNNKYRHSGRLGGTGTGKTTNLITTIQCRLEQGFKIIFFDTQNEGEFLNLPCPKNHPIYPKLIQSKRQPKGIKTHVLIPLAYSGGERVVQHEKIPENWDFFLLDLHKIDPAGPDWSILMNGISDVQEQLLKTSLLQKEPHWGILDIYHQCQRRFEQGRFGYIDSNVDEEDSEPIPVLKNVFPKESIRAFNRELMALNSSRFIAPHLYKGKPTPFLLNWEKEVMSRTTVTVLKVSLLPSRLRHAFCNYVVRLTFKMAQKRFLPDGRKIPPLAITIPESTDFFPQHIPEEYKETMPPLRQVFYDIFRRGRRYRVVVDYDTADKGSMDRNKVLNQTFFLFLFDNSKKILGECIDLYNLTNAEKLKKKLDLLKMKGMCLSLSRKNPIGRFIQSPVPSVWVPLEGESFIEIWRDLGKDFKPVSPYYETINKIFGSIKKEMRLSFDQLTLELETAKTDKKKEAGISDAIKEFAIFVYKFSVDYPEITLKSKPINQFLKDNPDAPSKMSVYNWLDRLHDFGLVKINREKRPHTFKVTNKMKEFLEVKVEESPVVVEESEKQSDPEKEHSKDWLKDDTFFSHEEPLDASRDSS